MYWPLSHLHGIYLKGCVRRVKAFAAIPNPATGCAHAHSKSRNAVPVATPIDFLCAPMTAAPCVESSRPRWRGLGGLYPGRRWSGLTIWSVWLRVGDVAPAHRYRSISRVLPADGSLNIGAILFLVLRPYCIRIQVSIKRQAELRLELLATLLFTYTR